MGKQRVFSGIQPIGDVHIGNYFGAIRNWVNIQNDYDCIFGVVDLHAMTMPYDPKVLKESSIDKFASLIASGIDLNRTIVIIQSQVPEHSELAWIFNCIASYGELSRMTQFKDKSQLVTDKSGKNFISAGLFTYPVLQAADILIYNAHRVPVGKDQEQHLELSRNIAVRFNKMFGEYFNEPKPLFTETPKIMSLADPSIKMSKSFSPKHYIGLFEEEDVVRKKVRSAVTDTGNTPRDEMSPGVQNLFSIIKACGKENEFTSLMNNYNKGELKYKDLKEVTTDALLDIITPLREKKAELMQDIPKLEKLAVEQSIKARAIASKIIKDVKQLTGINWGG